MGIAVSVLLHGIFFAGCLALDASSMSTSTTADQQPTELTQDAGQVSNHKVKS